MVRPKPPPPRPCATRCAGARRRSGGHPRRRGDGDWRFAGPWLLTNALENKDYYGAWVMRKGVGGFSESLSRHPISALTGQFIIFEYLHFLGNVPDDQREAVDAGHRHMLGHVQSLVDMGRFQSNLLGIEGMDVLKHSGWARTVVSV